VRVPSKIRLSVLGWWLLATLVTSTAAAQEPPLTAVLRPTVNDAADYGLGGAVERVLRARLDELAPVRVSGTPALSLRDLQLAVGCVGGTDECLASIASQLEVDALVLSNLDRADDTLMLSITVFDAREDGGSRRAARDATGERAASAIVSEVDGMVRELFDLPPPEQATEPDLSGGGRRPGASDDDGGGGGPGALPWVIAGGGVAALGVATVFGLMSKSNADDYASAPTGDAAEIDAALALRDDARNQATLANVLFAVGGGLVATGALLFVLGLGGDDGDEAVSVAPSLSPNLAALTVRGRFAGAL